MVVCVDDYEKGNNVAVCAEFGDGVCDTVEETGSQAVRSTVGNEARRDLNVRSVGILSLRKRVVVPNFSS